MTFGAELELADWNRSIHIPSEYGVKDVNDITVCNSDGTCVNPYINEGFGGEIVTTVCSNEQHLQDTIAGIMSCLDTYSINHSCWLHIHVGADTTFTLDELKFILSQVHKTNVLIANDSVFNPPKIPKGSFDLTADNVSYIHRRNATRLSYMTPEEYTGAMRSTTESEFWSFFERKRHIINMRPLKYQGTIEFRFWYMSDNTDRIRNAINWSSDFCKSVYSGHRYDFSYTPGIYPEPVHLDLDMEKAYVDTLCDKRPKLDNFTLKEQE